MSGRWSTPIHVRVSEDERETIEKHADRAGLKFSEYVRRAALGEWEAILGAGANTSAPPATASAPSPAERETPMAERVVGEEVAAEVTEATQLDDVARESFLERRTRQLVGQGKTTPVAKSLAEAEWRQRGAADPAAA